jgi:flavin reductase (DIM6/NTAB) family NADH-FMN oxidoreductase RutF
VDLDLAELPTRERYKLLSSLIVPRPIALVTSIDPDGRPNAAPYSFFNLFSHDPALVVLGIERHEPRRQKDTGRNIDLTGEFVVNLVDEDLAEAMNVCAIDFPPEVNELEMAGLALAPCRRVAAGRIAVAPVALECRTFTVMRIGRTRELVIGEILHIHLRDGIVDPATLRVELDRYRPIGRLFGDLYCRIRDVFTLPRRSFREWREAMASGLNQNRAAAADNQSTAADPARAGPKRPAG